VRSLTSEDFWQLYYGLPVFVRAQARQAYSLFVASPDHPSLRFKKLNGPGNFWSVRFGGEYRAVGMRDGESITWLWIGTRQAFGKEF
jgi:hypothetical protein